MAAIVAPAVVLCLNSPLILLEHVVDHCRSWLMSGSYVTNRRLPFTENYGKLKNFPTVLLGVTQRIPWAKKKFLGGSNMGTYFK